MAGGLTKLRQTKHIINYFYGHRSNSSLSYARGPVCDPIIVDTIPNLFAKSVAKNNDKLAIVSMSQRIEKTFAELDKDSDRLMCGLIKNGVKKGDRVGIWSPSCYEFVVTQIATIKLGAIMANINPGYRG